MKNITIAASFTVLMIISGCARNPVTGKRQVVLMSEAQEIATGKEADPQIVQQFGLYPDSALQRFINEKGKQMAAISHRPNLEYEFKIVDSDILNAFAIPGGYVYFTRGIMGHFNNEAEFAGVLGHELGHVTARHSVSQQSKGMLAQLGVLAGVIINPELGRFAETASQGLGLLMLKFGRDAEREADRLGVEYSSKIGYDAKQMAHFFTTLQRKQSESGANEIPPFLSTHPSPVDREATVGQLALEWQQKLNLTNAQVERNSYLKRIDGLIYGEDPKQGFVEGGIFYHPVLKFQFPVPTGWSFQNSPTQVQMASKDGRAILIFTSAQGASLQEASNNVVKQYNLQRAETESISVNGIPAMRIIADQQQQQQQQQQQSAAVLRTVSYLIQFGGTIYHMVGVSMATDFNNYYQTFLNGMQNFRELKDQAKINKKPERIRIKTARTNTTLQQALKQHNTPDKKMEELAVLNGMKLTDNVAAGTFIKVLDQ
ncbi:M48 family metalloprotease [Segetibacter sp.]|uniref:M48 family metalloprotease n=1 Tax=Segetibacter sp. TaxID=2231182 RepID=UPI00261AFC5E|nr:M48 family metalloprotease [Segetibacter sp.]MCW3080758.1 peptidase [Segetibacter sp.]